VLPYSRSAIADIDQLRRRRYRPRRYPRPGRWRILHRRTSRTRTTTCTQLTSLQRGGAGNITKSPLIRPNLAEGSPRGSEEFIPEQSLRQPQENFHTGVRCALLLPYHTPADIIYSAAARATFTRKSTAGTATRPSARVSATR
jgi:hypothetical protein